MVREIKKLKEVLNQKGLKVDVIELKPTWYSIEIKGTGGRLAQKRTQIGALDIVFTSLWDNLNEFEALIDEAVKITVKSLK